MWPFKYPEQSGAREPDPPTSTDEAIRELESRMTHLELEWENVISKLRSKYARDAAREKRALEASLDQSEQMADDQTGPHIADGVSPGSQEWRARAKAALNQRAAQLRANGGRSI